MPFVRIVFATSANVSSASADFTSGCITSATCIVGLSILAVLVGRREEVPERHREVLVDGLGALGLPVVGPARGPFVLVRVGAHGERIRHGLRRAGYAVRRGDTFPGLGPEWIRLAVRDPEVTAAFLAAHFEYVGSVREFFRAVMAVRGVDPFFSAPGSGSLLGSSAAPQGRQTAIASTNAAVLSIRIRSPSSHGAHGGDHLGP